MTGADVRDENGLPICDCKRARKQHEHGERGMYTYHRCRCAPCTHANTEYDRQAKAHKKRVPKADAGLARKRIGELRAAGLLMSEIAEMCGVNAKVLDYTLYGRNGRKPATVLATTLNALNAIRHKDIATLEVPPGRRISGDSARRQVQALHCFGWSPSTIAARTGATPSTISNLLSGAGIVEGLRVRIDQLYQELHGVEAPTDTAKQKRKATRARGRAAVNGWTPDTANNLEYAFYRAA